jgi:hypothetical protein
LFVASDKIDEEVAEFSALADVVRATNAPGSAYLRVTTLLNGARSRIFKFCSNAL